MSNTYKMNHKGELELMEEMKCRDCVGMACNDCVDMSHYHAKLIVADKTSEDKFKAEESNTYYYIDEIIKYYRENPKSEVKFTYEGETILQNDGHIMVVDSNNLNVLKPVQLYSCSLDTRWIMIGEEIKTKEAEKRISIQCSEKDMEQLLKIFEYNCPFIPNFPSNCGEDSRCSECIEKHINFGITD